MFVPESLLEEFNEECPNWESLKNKFDESVEQEEEEDSDEEVRDWWVDLEMDKQISLNWDLFYF